MKLILEPTQTAHWYSLINEAEAVCHYQLHQDLESYLVFLLMRFMQKPEVASSILVEDFFRAFHQAGRLRNVNMQSVGDKCLLLAGLYPDRAKRQCGDLDFVSSLGKMAYRSINEYSTAELYQTLAKAWPVLQEVLYAVRSRRGEFVNFLN